MQALGGEEEGGGAGAVLGVHCRAVLQEVEGCVLGGWEGVYIAIIPQGGAGSMLPPPPEKIQTTTLRSNLVVFGGLADYPKHYTLYMLKQI